MDTPIPKRSFFFRYRYYLLGSAIFLCFAVYVLIVASGGRKLKVEQENVIIAEVKREKFIEYVEVEGVVQPILTIRINTSEGGSVKQIIAEEGSSIKKGDTILTLTNPELIRTIEDAIDDREKQLILAKEKEIEIEQKNISIKQQTLEALHEFSILEKSFRVLEEEYKLGAGTRFNLELEREKFHYKQSRIKTQLEAMQHDSAALVIRKQLNQRDLDRELRRTERSIARSNNLVVLAPMDGQLSLIKVGLGQQVSGSETVAELKILEPFKITTSLNEYYIDRITTGLPASVNWQDKLYKLKISKIIPEVKDRSFVIDLVFTNERPDNVRIGKNYRIKIELDQPSDAIVIPRGDFFNQTGGRWIYKLNKQGDKGIKTEITISRQNPGQYEVTSGLVPGDRIIISGYNSFGDAEELILK